MRWKKKLTVCVESLFFSRLITDIGFRLVAADFRVLPVCLGESQLWSDHDLAQRQLPMCSQCNSNYRYYVTIVQQLPEGLWKLPPGHFFNFRNQSVFMPHCQHSVAISSSLKTVGFDLNILNYLHCRSKNGPIIFHSWFMSICCSYPFTEPTLFCKFHSLSFQIESAFPCESQIQIRILLLSFCVRITQYTGQWAGEIRWVMFQLSSGRRKSSHNFELRVLVVWTI